MGLDVILHQKVHIVDIPVDDANCFQVHVIDSGFQQNISMLKNRSYYVSEIREHRIGYAYSFHSEFRDYLCILIGKKKNYWRAVHCKSDPFHELLYFADNEGYIDWKASDNLFNDFLEFLDIAFEKGNPLLYSYYVEWMNLFEVARIKGNVIEFR